MSKTKSNIQQEPNFDDMTEEEKAEWAYQKSLARVDAAWKERRDLLRCTNRDFNTGFRMGWEYRQKLYDDIDKIFRQIK